MKNLLDELKVIINSPFTSRLEENELVLHLIEKMYDYYDCDLTGLVLSVDKIKKARQAKEIANIKHGLLNSIHTMSHSIEFKDHIKTKKGKDMYNLLYGADDFIIPMIIPIMKAHFPDAKLSYHSESERNWFNHYLNIFLSMKDKYLEGDSKEWAKTMGYYNYMVKLVENNIKEKE